MAALLYLGVRPERAAADAEHASFRRGLGADELDRIDLLDAPLDPAVLDRYRAVVVGGSPFDVTAAQPSALQRRVESDLEMLAAAAVDQRIAALFTCYGIGVVTRMLGGTVGTDHPESASAAVIRTTADAADDPVFASSAPALSAFTAHKEAANTTPPGAVLLAENDACPVHAYRVGAQLYATQFHPEASPADFAERMTFYRGSGYFDAAEFDRVRDRVLAARVDGDRLLRRFAEAFAG